MWTKPSSWVTSVMTKATSLCPTWAHSSSRLAQHSLRTKTCIPVGFLPLELTYGPRPMQSVKGDPSRNKVQGFVSSLAQALSQRLLLQAGLGIVACSTSLFFHQLNTMRLRLLTLPYSTKWGLVLLCCSSWGRIAKGHPLTTGTHTKLVCAWQLSCKSLHGLKVTLKFMSQLTVMQVETWVCLTRTQVSA